ncbi:MAG TPA: hypothetical protein VF210_21700 [Pseudomonadales bacterium]
MTLTENTRRKVALALVLAAVSATGSADERLELPGALTDEQLDELRGGFTADGLWIGFALEQVVRLDGESLGEVRLELPVTALGDLGRSFADLTGGAGLTTLIQNRLDGRHIEHRMVLNLDLFGTSLLNSAPVHGAMLPAAAEALVR